MEKNCSAMNHMKKSLSSNIALDNNNNDPILWWTYAPPPLPPIPTSTSAFTSISTSTSIPPTSIPTSILVCMDDNINTNSSSNKILPYINMSNFSPVVSPSSFVSVVTNTRDNAGANNTLGYRSNSNLSVNCDMKNSSIFLSGTYPCTSNVLVLCHINDYPANSLHSSPPPPPPPPPYNLIYLQQPTATPWSGGSGSIYDSMNTTPKKESIITNSGKVNINENAPTRDTSTIKNKNNNNTIHEQRENRSLPCISPCEPSDIYAAMVLSLLSQDSGIHVHEDTSNPNTPSGRLQEVPSMNCIKISDEKLKSIDNRIRFTNEEKNLIKSTNDTTKYQIPSHNSFRCNHCDRVYQSEKGLKRHERVHDPSTRGCPYCDKKFARKSYLLDHIRTHTGEKPYVCPSCRKCFACKRNLNQHIRTHSDVKRYCCPWCDHKFRVNQSLKVHLIKAHRFLNKTK